MRPAAYPRDPRIGGAGCAADAHINLRGMGRILHLLVAASLLLAGCASVPWARDDATPEPAQVTDGSAERAALNARVYDAVVRHVVRRFHRREAISDFRAHAAAQRDAVVAQPDEAGLYAGLSTLLERLDDDHSYVTSPGSRVRHDALRAGTAVADTGLRTQLVGETYFVSTVRPDSPAPGRACCPDGGWWISMACRPRWPHHRPTASAARCGCSTNMTASTCWR